LLNVMKLDANARSARDMEYIQLMEETCDNMQRLISELLDLSRIEQGTTHLDIRPVSITKVLREMEDHFRTWARNKGIELAFRNELTTATIFTDHDILVRILDNLLSNAIKFSPSHKAVSLIAREEGNQLLFDIRDQGPGIRIEERDKLFQRFQTLSARPTNGESSSGLGLSIVKDLVGLLKGSIQVESDNGHGACFTIRIPRSLDEVVA
jgi:signal transduction histidine kinase